MQPEQCSASEGTWRVNAYLQQLQLVVSRFRRATSARKKLEAMRDLEMASHHEMGAFLKTAHQSRFVM